MNPTEHLIAFLRARLDEDEAAVLSGECRCADGQPKRPDCADRVLAKVNADRQIVDWCARMNPPYDLGGIIASEARKIALLLAVPYAGHPDYREEEWRP